MPDKKTGPLREVRKPLPKHSATYLGRSEEALQVCEQTAAYGRLTRLAQVVTDVVVIMVAFSSLAVYFNINISAV